MMATIMKGFGPGYRPYLSCRSQFMTLKCGTASAIRFAAIVMYHSISKYVNPWRITRHRKVK